MSISKAIYKILSSETDLTDLVSTRIFPSIVPQNETYPSILFEIKDIEPIEIKARRHPKAEARIVIGVHGTTYGDVQNISDIVISTLERYKDETDYALPETGISGVPPTGGCSIVEGYWIQEVFYDTSFDVFNDTLRVYEKYLEFDLRYMVNPASMGAYAWYGGTIAGLLSKNATIRQIPSANDDNISLCYSGGGDSSLNLTQGSEVASSAKPKYRVDGSMRFDQEAATDPASFLELAATDGVNFTNGCTILMVLKKASSEGDSSILPIHAGAISGGDAGAYVKMTSVGATNSVAIAIGGFLVLYVAGTAVPNFEDKTYFAFSWGATGDETGEYQIYDPNGDILYAHKARYVSFSYSTSGATFRFKRLGSNGTEDGTFDLFDCVMFNKKLTFGGGQYNRIKNYLLNKHNLD